MRVKARPLILAAALVAGVLAAVPASAAVIGSSPTPAAASAPSLASSLCPDADTATFGPNVCVFTPSMSQAAIQTDLNAIADPAGPGRSPVRQRRLLGVLRAGYLRLRGRPARVPGRLLHPGRRTGRPAPGHGHQRRHRGVQRPVHRGHQPLQRRRQLLAVAVQPDAQRGPAVHGPGLRAAGLDASGAGCDNTDEFWAVSQAAPIRRIIINGNLVFQAYCANNNYASGGFIADSQVSGKLVFRQPAVHRAQQQHRRRQRVPERPLEHGLLRRPGRAARPSSAASASRTRCWPPARSPRKRRSFTRTRAGKFRVFVPSVQTNSSGPSCRAAPRPASRCRCRRSSSPTRRRRSRRSTSRSRRARTSC